MFKSVLYGCEMKRLSQEIDEKKDLVLVLEKQMELKDNIISSQTQVIS